MAIEYLEKKDILLNNCQITGVMDLAPGIVELTLTPVEEIPEDNAKEENLLQSIRQITVQVDASLREAGYTMETEVTDRLLKFMDL